jgi:hypothetical protein
MGRAVHGRAAASNAGRGDRGLLMAVGSGDANTPWIGGEAVQPVDPGKVSRAPG